MTPEVKKPEDGSKSSGDTTPQDSGESQDGDGAGEDEGPAFRGDIDISSGPQSGAEGDDTGKDEEGRPF